MNTDKHRFRSILFYLCLSVCICGSISSSSFADPKLLVDNKDLDALKQKIAGPFSAQWKTLRDGVDRAMSDPIVLPPRGGNWSHNYVCPIHGARLKQAKQIGPWKWEHICPVGPHVLHGDPSKGTTDFDGNAIMGVHLGYADLLVNLGLVYQVTGDERYARRSREILLAYADKYESYPLHDNQGRLGSGGHVASQSLTEASWLIQMAQGADLVWDTLSDDDRQTVEKKLLRPALDEVIIPHNYGIHNIQCRQNSAIGLVGFLLNDKSLIDKAIDDPKSGFRAQIAKGVRDDGMWLEGASGYHFFTIDGLWPLAEAARHAGIDLYSPRFKMMFDGPLNLAMPDLRLPNFNDGGVVDLSDRADSYDLAYARWHDPKYLALISAKPRAGKLALLYGDVGWASPTTAAVGHAHPAETSRNLPASGFAILQQKQDDAATWLCLKYGPHGGGHGHLDKNHFILWSNDSILMPDAGTHAYGSPLHGSWDKSSLAHNTLVVDEKSQLPAEGKCLAFGSQDGIDFAVTDAGEAYSDRKVRFVRSVAMINPKLIVVIDQIRADKEHTLDLAAHLTGKWVTGKWDTAVSPSHGTSGEETVVSNPWSAPNTDGYRVLASLTTRQSSSPITLRTMLSNNRTTSITLAGDTPTEIITGTGVGETTTDRVPIALFRRHAKSTAYVWAISINSDAPKITLLNVTRDGQAVDPSIAIAVELTTANGSIGLLANPDAQPIQAPWHGNLWKSQGVFSARK